MIGSEPIWQKKQLNAEKELRSHIETAAKSHPLFNKSFKQLKDTYYSDLTGKEVMVKNINAGQYVVDLIMSRIRYDVISEENKKSMNR